MMRENDLIWNYVISNYLQGRAPPAFDILHWNADSTRLPARMLTDFLRGIYMENSLIEAGVLASRWPAHRPRTNQDTLLLPLDHRGSHCPLESDLSGNSNPLRSGAVCARRLRPHCRSYQSAVEEKVRILDS